MKVLASSPLLFLRFFYKNKKFRNNKPLSHCHKFAHDMRRVSGSYNSPHIATNVHELCHKRFGQKCSTSSTRHVHDIHDEISVDSCDPVRNYTILVQILRYVTRATRNSYDMSTSSCEFVGVLHDHSRISTI